MKRILFICADNSVLSQMAEAFLKRITFNRVEVFSAGIKPKAMNQMGIRVMKELGIDVSDQRSKSVNEFYHDKFDYVITVHDIARGRHTIAIINVRLFRAVIPKYIKALMILPKSGAQNRLSWKNSGMFVIR